MVSPATRSAGFGYTLRVSKPSAPAIVGVLLALAFAGLLALHRGALAAPDDAHTRPASISELRTELQSDHPSLQRLPEGARRSIAYTLDVAERIAKSFPSQAAAWRVRAARDLGLAKQGQDPFRAQRGKIALRGYRSQVSEHLQGYAVYVPPDYDPARSYPLAVMLHGGSANGNLFLGVVLGNNMNWKDYSIHLWDEFEPRWSPEWIVVAPDGFGHVMWRWMGEQDLLDVIDDVQRNYNVDASRVVLSGLSNGGVGAYNLGMRHAHRFSVVQAMAGAPSWLQYAGGDIPEAQRQAMVPLSGMELLENAVNTDFRYYHGRLDGGPMKPRFIEALGKRVRELGVPFKETWFDVGHDLLYLVQRKGRVYQELEPIHRRERPSEVRVVTGDYRAARQHWAEITRIENYPEIARLRAVIEGAELRVETQNTLAFSLDLASAPLVPGSVTSISIDGKQVASGLPAKLGASVRFNRTDGKWCSGGPPDSGSRLEKKPGSSGPITDAYYGALLHVYGTADSRATEALKRSAMRGAQGWPLWLWRVQQKVVADTEVTDEMMRDHHLVLYASPGSNGVLERVLDRLPLRITPDAISLGEQTFRGTGVGVKLVHPNPLAPSRYVIVQAATTTSGVEGGNRLPDFLPDFVVYDASTTLSRPRLVFDRKHAPLAMGYFDRNWKLPAPTGAQPAQHAPGASPPPEQPHQPPGGGRTARELGGSDRGDGASPVLFTQSALKPAMELETGGETQAAQAARRIAEVVPTFANYRSKIRKATWITDPAARWSIRDNDVCLQALQELHVPARSVTPLLATPMPTPVEVTGSVDGVWFRMAHANRSLLMSCEIAARLPIAAKVMRAHQIQGVSVISSYRDHPFPSFHTFGLALDFGRFFTPGFALNVLADFQKTPDHETCQAPPAKQPKAQALREIACDLAETRAFSSVLTPNYNVGHRDHFHVDVRPEDERLFVR
jgi:enterochelin esterase-like enzyme